MRATFSKSKVIDYFLKLCDQAPKTTVDWDKFRELDKKEIFSDYSNKELSMRFRTYNLRRKGICYYCGKNKATENNGTCEICNKKIKRMNGKIKDK